MPTGPASYKTTNLLKQTHAPHQHHRQRFVISLYDTPHAPPPPPPDIRGCEGLFTASFMRVIEPLPHRSVLDKFVSTRLLNPHPPPPHAGACRLWMTTTAVTAG